jgi:carbonic anhydrase/acetyltransferase-like protein (isoleucine patch superfamily)
MASQMLIFGTGAHARKVYHYATDGGWKVVGFVDEAAGVTAPIATVPVWPVNELCAPDDDIAMFIAIGRADVRQRIMDRMGKAGWKLPALIHRSAWVAPDARLGDGVLVAAGAIVETATVIERGAIIDIGVVLDHECAVGAFCHLRAGEVYGPRSSISSPV